MDGHDQSQKSPSVRPVLSANKARQGVTGQNVRYVLYIGTGAVIVLFAVVYILFFGH
ncbi:MAG TPA: hypothetical protein VFA53_07955 [Xanthobacteraceae bacterium]|nr:hypothetical protein [Xanthobacteraceae bacterium]